MSNQKPRGFVRFSVSQRLQHLVLIISFTLLAVTGLPQKFAGDGWAEALISVFGGIDSIRLIHHLAAIVLALASIYHVLEIAYDVFVLHVRWTMFPELQDVKDAIAALLHNLGFRKEWPQFEHFSFEQKFEYWALVWGTLIMGMTGFMLWNPILISRVLPGEVIPAAKAAHGGEAILAVLAILVWHVYNVHIKTFNKSIFTGRLDEHQMAEEHGMELERIRQGNVDLPPDPAVIRYRQRWFFPFAAAFGILLVILILYFFGPAETTAITTVPRRTPVPVFVRPTVTMTPVARLTPGVAGSPTAGAAKPLPPDHAGRTTCNACHETGAAGPKNPADHAGRADTTCTACHKPPAAPGETTPAATPTSKPAASPTTGVAKPLPASHAGRTTCNACHETGAAGPKNPADHAGRADTTCTACHKPPAASGGTTPVTAGPKPLPASHAGRTICNACHETGAAGPKNPDDHAGRADTTCTACHKPPP